MSLLLCVFFKICTVIYLRESQSANTSKKMWSMFYTIKVNLIETCLGGGTWVHGHQNLTGEKELPYGDFHSFYCHYVKQTFLAETVHWNNSRVASLLPFDLTLWVHLLLFQNWDFFHKSIHPWLIVQWLQVLLFFFFFEAVLAALLRKWVTVAKEVGLVVIGLDSRRRVRASAAVSVYLFDASTDIGTFREMSGWIYGLEMTLVDNICCCLVCKRMKPLIFRNSWGCGSLL